jgi:hypothetical protein
MTEKESNDATATRTNKNPKMQQHKLPEHQNKITLKQNEKFQKYKTIFPRGAKTNDTHPFRASKIVRGDVSTFNFIVHRSRGHTHLIWVGFFLASLD